MRGIIRYSSSSGFQVLTPSAAKFPKHRALRLSVPALAGLALASSLLNLWALALEQQVAARAVGHECKVSTALLKAEF